MPGVDRPPPAAVDSPQLLHRAGVLDAADDAPFPGLVELAALFCGASAAALGLLDGPDVHFVAARGLRGARARAAVAEAARRPAPADGRDAAAELGPYCASAPIVLPGRDLHVGALCVLDEAPIDSPAALRALELLASQAALHIAAKLRLGDVRQEMLQFMARMTHELRTPLNGVQGVTELLQRCCDGGDGIQEHLTTLQESVTLGLHMVNGILDFSKVEAGKVQLESIPFSLRGCIEGVVSMVRPAGTLSPVELGYEFPADAGDVEVVGDPSKLRQVLLNLLANAVKFTAAGSVVLTVTRSPFDPDHPGCGYEELHFEVRDTGVGIAPDKIPFLFRPYAQVDCSTSRQYGGTGLGLAISQALVEAMGGRLTVESEPHKGTVFRFALVLPAETKPLPAALEGRRVLLIEPHDVRRAFLISHCTTLQLQVHPYPRLEDVTQVLSPRAGMFDAVLCPAELLAESPAIRAWDIPILPVGGGMHLHSSFLTPPRRAFGPHLEVRAPRWSSLPDPPSPRSPPSPSPSSYPFPRSPAHNRYRAPVPDPPRLLPPILCSALDRRLRILWGLESPKVASNPILSLPAQYAHLRVLVADDNPINQKVLAGFVRRLGAVVDVALDGEQVLERCSVHQYDVAFLDLQMPGMGGLAAARVLQAQKGAPYMVAVSGHPGEEIRLDCLQAGMAEFLPKPIHFDDVARVLRQVAVSHGPEGSRYEGSDVSQSDSSLSWADQSASLHADGGEWRGDPNCSPPRFSHRISSIGRDTSFTGFDPTTVEAPDPHLNVSFGSHASQSCSPSRTGSIIFGQRSPPLCRVRASTSSITLSTTIPVPPSPPPTMNTAEPTPATNPLSASPRRSVSSTASFRDLRSAPRPDLPKSTTTCTLGDEHSASGDLADSPGRHGDVSPMRRTLKNRYTSWLASRLGLQNNSSLGQLRHAESPSLTRDNSGQLLPSPSAPPTPSTPSTPSTPPLAPRPSPPIGPQGFRQLRHPRQRSSDAEPIEG